MEERRSHICLYGGSFDPPHLGHLFAAVWALQTTDIDRLLWVPAWQHAWGKELAPFDQRCAMLEAMLRGLGERMAVSRIEQELGGVSRTIRTVSALEARYPDARFSVLVGSDVASEVHRWMDAETLFARVSLLVAGRAGAPLAPGEPGDGLRIPDVSSTELRAALARGDEAYCRPRMNAEAFAMCTRWGCYR